MTSCKHCVMLMYNMMLQRRHSWSRHITKVCLAALAHVVVPGMWSTCNKGSAGACSNIGCLPLSRAWQASSQTIIMSACIIVATKAPRAVCCVLSGFARLCITSLRAAVYRQSVSGCVSPASGRLCIACYRLRQKASRMLSFLCCRLPSSRA